MLFARCTRERSLFRQPIYCSYYLLQNRIQFYWERHFSATTNAGSDIVTTTTDSTGICHVKLNRPKKLNALDLGMFEAIANTAINLQRDHSIRAVILSGEGRAFR